jgi:hypothetical protein
MPVKRELGEAISIEDALSIMIVIFVLFIIFLVPLVNIDKIKLEKAEQDTYWDDLAAWVRKEPVQNLDAYTNSFALSDHQIRITEAEGFRYVNAVSENGDITVVEHKLSDNSFTALVVKGKSTVATFRYGQLKWSAGEKSWFATADLIDYGDRAESLDMKNRLVSVTKAQPGF